MDKKKKQRVERPKKFQPREGINQLAFDSPETFDKRQQQQLQQNGSEMQQRYGATKAIRRMQDLAKLPQDIPEVDPEMLVLNRNREKREEGILEPEKTFVFFGKRGTGKTFALRYLIYHIRRHYPRVLVMTNTKFNGFWQDYVHNDYIHEGFDPFVIHAVIEQQKQLMKYLNLDHPEERENINPNLAIIDDIISDSGFKYSEDLNAIFTEGRHNKISIWLTTQYAKAINTVGRGNTDYAIILAQFMERQQESLANDFLNFIHKDAAYELIDRFTCIERLEEMGADEHQLLVVKLCENSKDLNNILFKLNADDPGKFTLGDPQYQKIPGQ